MVNPNRTILSTHIPRLALRVQMPHLVMLVTTMLAMTCWAPTALGQETAQREIRRPSATPVLADQVAATQPANQPTTLAGLSIDMGRVIAATAIVIGLILLMRLLAKRFLGIGTNTPDDAVRVLKRTLISPRQQVILLQVGRRIIVACDSGGQVTTLTTITDSDEIAELTSKISGKASIAGAFDSALEEEAAHYQSGDLKLTPDGVAAHDPDPIANLRGEIGSLIDRIRSLSKSGQTPGATPESTAIMRGER